MGEKRRILRAAYRLSDADLVVVTEHYDDGSEWEWCANRNCRFYGWRPDSSRIMPATSGAPIPLDKCARDVEWRIRKWLVEQTGLRLPQLVRESWP